MKDLTKDQGIKLALVSLAEYYKENLTKNQISMYSEDLECLTLDELSIAIRKYRNESKNTRFPLPSALVALVRQPPVEPRDAGVETATRIIAAIKKHGYVWCLQGGFAPHSTFQEAVISELGELAWNVIQLDGGWSSICEFSSEENNGTLHAQLRDKAAMLFNKARNGTLGVLPSLPQQDSFKQISSKPMQIGEVLGSFRNGQ